MKEIKFRAWDKVKKEMINELICFGKNADGTTWINHDNSFNNEKNGYMWNSRNLEIMQFTGIKDCEGKEIYEGDIVECYDHPTGIDSCTAEVVFLHGMFKAKDMSFPLSDYGTVWIKVLGNIYENPELIKEVNNDSSKTR